MQFPRYTIAGLMMATAVVAVLVALATRDWRMRIIEELNSPMQVVGFSPTGLQLADGRTVLPKGIQALPAQSVALTIAASSGVEVAGDGCVYGLVRIDRWCGNDPIAVEIRRVDLALLLEFVNEAKPTTPTSSPYPIAIPAGGSFRIGRWEVGEYLYFQRWRDHLQQMQSKAAVPVAQAGP